MQRTHRSLCLVGAAITLVVGLGCSGGGEATGSAAAPPTTAPASAAAAVTAQAIIDAIADRWPAPNQNDNTSGCKAQPGDNTSGCKARITTDAVTVTEWEDEATAARAAKAAGDHRQVGRFVLSWTARDQDLTSDQARDSMVDIAKSLIG